MEFTEHELDLIDTYWLELPEIKLIEREVEQKIVHQNFRYSILQILREGHLYLAPSSNREIHVFSAKEIMAKLQEKLKMSIKLPGLYFHLDKLEENKLITGVLKIKIKKNNIVYYGLTARFFSSDASLISNQHSLISGNIDDHGLKDDIRTLQLISSSISSQLVSDCMQELKDLKEEQATKEFNSWVKSHDLAGELQDSIILFLYKIFKLRSSSVENINSLLDLLGID